MYSTGQNPLFKSSFHFPLNFVPLKKYQESFSIKMSQRSWQGLESVSQVAFLCDLSRLVLSFCPNSRNEWRRISRQYINIRSAVLPVHHSDSVHAIGLPTTNQQWSAPSPVGAECFNRYEMIFLAFKLGELFTQKSSIVRNIHFQEYEFL